jgi:hypothetical protein
MDFAMKFESTKHLEKQDEFYGKRGLTWHITVLAFNEKTKLQTLTLVHLLENVAQDSNCVLGIIDSVLLFIKKNFENPTINIRSDNAGCYHCQDVIGLLNFFAKKHNVEVLSYHFCEPQLGKDICDRKISVLRRIIIQYIHDGHDVTNINEMKNAILSNKSMNDIIVFTCTINETLNFKKKVNIPNISKYHSFLYEGEKIIIFRYYNIGSGIEMNLKDIINDDKIKELVKNGGLEISFDSSQFVTKFLTLSGKKITDYYNCEQCAKRFLSKKDLDNHENVHENKMSQIDVYQLKYANALVDTRETNSRNEKESKNIVCNVEINKEKLQMGFAIRDRKKVRFSEAQIKYLVDLFEKGERDTKNRARPSAVEADMIKNFPENLCLTVKQITSYFSRLSMNKKKSKGHEAKVEKSKKRKNENENLGKSRKAKQVDKDKNEESDDALNKEKSNENESEEELFFENNLTRENIYNFRKRLTTSVLKEIDSEIDDF